MVQQISLKGGGVCCHCGWLLAPPGAELPRLKRAFYYCSSKIWKVV